MRRPINSRESEKKMELSDFINKESIVETFENHPENQYNPQDCPHCQALQEKHDNDYLRCKKHAAEQAFLNKSLRWGSQGLAYTRYEHYEHEECDYNTLFFQGRAKNTSFALIQRDCGHIAKYKLLLLYQKYKEEGWGPDEDPFETTPFTYILNQRNHPLFLKVMSLLAVHFSSTTTGDYTKFFIQQVMKAAGEAGWHSIEE